MVWKPIVPSFCSQNALGQVICLHHVTKVRGQLFSVKIMVDEREEDFDVCFGMLDEQMLNELFEDDMDTSASDMGLKQDDLTHFSCENCSKMYKTKGRPKQTHR